MQFQKLMDAGLPVLQPIAHQRLEANEKQVPTNKEWREARKLWIPSDVPARSPDTRNQHTGAGGAGGEACGRQANQRREVWGGRHPWGSGCAAGLRKLQMKPLAKGYSYHYGSTDPLTHYTHTNSPPPNIPTTLDKTSTTILLVTSLTSHTPKPHPHRPQLILKSPEVHKGIIHNFQNFIAYLKIFMNSI